MDGPYYSKRTDVVHDTVFLLVLEPNKQGFINYKKEVNVDSSQTN